MNKIIDFEINENIVDINRILQIEEQCKNNNLLNIEDIDILLQYLSYLVRKVIADYEKTDMKGYSYHYKCDLAQSIICYYLDSLGIKVNPVNTNEVIKGVCGHSLVIANFETTSGLKKYLIDPTYIQFFEKENCDISKFIIINDMVCVSPDPGYFVVKEGKENVILPLLENGYIEFSEDVAKVYGDSFFQTKQGVNLSQIKNNVASGTNYIKWFDGYTSHLSKTIEELSDLNLLISPMIDISEHKR